MRSLRDPAPSRLSYRVNRLLLTPGFRVFLRFGLPVLLLVAIVGGWASNPDRREALADATNDLKRQVEERPEFLVRMMVVEGASPDIEADIRRNLPVNFPVSSFDLDLDTLRDAIADFDPVARASVQIVGGGILTVTIEERVPVVVHRLDGALVLLDSDGHRVNDITSRKDRPDLPLILGEGAGDHVAEALRIVAAAEPIAARIRGLRRVGERRWDILLDRDQVVMLPEIGARVAVERVIALDQAQDLLARDLKTIDFRNPNRPVLRLSDAAMEDLAETRTRAYVSTPE